MPQHQFIDRSSNRVMTEQLFGDRIVRFLYSTARENSPRLFRKLTGPRMCRWLSTVHFDWPFTARLLGNRRFLESCGVDLSECLGEPESFRTARQVFERRIRYWQVRPMPADPLAVASPCDARMVVGSFADSSSLYLKGKFFDLGELLGDIPHSDGDTPLWLERFSQGDFAIFRLTPEKYHYNHLPVTGRVADFYSISGDYHCCNPSAVVELVTPYSKNKRVVTVLDTDVQGGSRVGMVAMIEVVALMIGEVVQCYSRRGYDDPQPLRRGMLLDKGAPKSLYRPGSSTTILIFEKGKVEFAKDLLSNQRRPDAQSRFSIGFRRPLVETEVRVRSLIGWRRKASVVRR